MLPEKKLLSSEQDDIFAFALLDIDNAIKYHLLPETSFSVCNYHFKCISLTSVPSLKAYLCIFFSTVSSSITALVAVTVEDFILPVYKDLTEKQVSWMNMSLSKLQKQKTSKIVQKSLEATVAAIWHYIYIKLK